MLRMIQYPDDDWGVGSWSITHTHTHTNPPKPKPTKAPQIHTIDSHDLPSPPLDVPRRNALRRVLWAPHLPPDQRRPAPGGVLPRGLLHAAAVWVLAGGWVNGSVCVCACVRPPPCSCSLGIERWVGAWVVGWRVGLSVCLSLCLCVVFFMHLVGGWVGGWLYDVGLSWGIVVYACA
jgi:hypothetical protein